MASLLAYGWPGNVRELVHVLERAAALSRRARSSTSADLPPQVRAAEPVARAAPISTTRASRCARRWPPSRSASIERALDRAGGNRAEAARRLGIARTQLYAKMEEHGLGGREKAKQPTE